MAEIVPLCDAVCQLVGDGDVVALEGFTHLIRHAAGHELIRQGRRDLTLVRMTIRGYLGTDLAAQTSSIATVTCPFTGEELVALPALRPDVGVIHAQKADESGNVQMWGITGVQKETLLAAARSSVTVEEIVPELELRAGGVVLPSWVIDSVSLAPSGAHPSYAHGYYDRDNAFYRAWDEISRDRETFAEWMQRHVLDTADVEGYHASIEVAA